MKKTLSVETLKEAKLVIEANLFDYLEDCEVGDFLIKLDDDTLCRYTREYEGWKLDKFKDEDAFEEDADENETCILEDYTELESDHIIYKAVSQFFKDKGNQNLSSVYVLYP